MAGRRAYSTLEKLSDLEDLYLNQNLSLVEIARIKHSGVRTIRMYLREMGIPLRSKTEAMRIVIALGKRNNFREEKYDWSDLKELYVGRKLSAREIAEIKGCTETGVLAKLKKIGIQRRNGSEASSLAVLRGKKPLDRKGIKHPRWKGGRWIDIQGYVRIYCPEHPRILNKRGIYMREHILVWEQAHNKLLPKGWVIHHINGVKDDNRPENLVAYPNRTHAKKEMGEVYKSRIRQLEAKIKYLERALDSQQMIFWTEN